MGALVAMIVKELWASLRDPRQRMTLILPPILQLMIFSYATTLDVSRVDIAVLDRSSGVHAQEFIRRVAASPTFRSVTPVGSSDELRHMVDNRKVIAAVIIEPGFDRMVTQGKPAEIGVVLDGRRSNAAQIVSGYLSRIAAGMGAGTRARSRSSSGGVVVTNWYNPALDYLWFTIPSLVAMIVAVGSLALSSQSVARERELGTFDQLMVSPLTVWQILVGKMMPPFTIGVANGLLYWLLAYPLFGVPFTGSFALFLMALCAYALSLVGLGMFVSSLCKTQQQAFLGSFVVMVPLILLSGYAAPVENMPDWLQIVSLADPMRYFLVIVQGLFLKSMPAADVFHQLWPLLVIAALTLIASAWLFRARME